MKKSVNMLTQTLIDNLVDTAKHYIIFRFSSFFVVVFGIFL